MPINYTSNDVIELFDNSSYLFIHKINRIRDEINFKHSNVQKYESLTKREEEILSLVVQDYCNQKIAALLFISRCTVEQHRKNINRKLGLNSAIQLYRFALAFDLI